MVADGIGRTSPGQLRTTGALIRVYLRGRDWLHSAEAERTEPAKIWRGRTPEELYVFQDRLPPGAHYIEEWADHAYRAVWAFESERMLLTYCEGDLDLTEDPDLESFNARIVEAHRFYTGRVLADAEIGCLLGEAGPS